MAVRLVALGPAVTRPAAGSALTAVGTALAVGLTAHTWLNLRHLRRPAPVAAARRLPPVSVLLPLRDEADRVGPCLTALLDSEYPGDIEIVILDDRSSDGTGDLVRAAVGGDPRFCVIDGIEPEPGWLGKPWACRQLAAAADRASQVLVFVDADVVLAPTALAETVALLLDADLDLISPYPRQIAETAAERVIQPLLQWSWLTTLPLRHAERSQRESLAAANGQLLAIRRTAYDECGGHGAVRGDVLDDVALLRAVKRVGGTGGVVDGTALATCRMYDGWPDLRDGYSKSLWRAFGPPPAAAAVIGVLGLAYLVPPVAALRGSAVGAIGYAAGVAGRAMVAERVAGRVWPDSAAHPASIAALGYLTARSHLLRRRGRLQWKGRAVVTDATGGTTTDLGGDRR